MTKRLEDASLSPFACDRFGKTSVEVVFSQIKKLKALICSRGCSGGAMVLDILPVQGLPTLGGALVRVAQWVKRWPTDLADRV